MKTRTKIFIFIALLFIVLIVYVARSTKKIDNSAELQIDVNAKANPEIEVYINEAFELLKENGKKSEEVWNKYDLSKNSIIVCQRDDNTNKVIHAWKLTTTEKTRLTNEQLMRVELPAAGSYNSIKFEGKKSIIIAINKDSSEIFKNVAIKNYIYEVGVHEMYHFHYESMFKLMKLGREQKEHGGRGTEFPKAAEPRVYRKMLYDNLVLAFENPKDEKIYLGKAKYWSEKWKTEYPGEYYQAKITDIMEGKARYIQYMLCMPKNLSDTEETTWITNFFDKSIEPSISIDSESYKLGFVSGVLLDRKESNWKEQITKNPETPVEYLLKNVEVIKDDSNDYKEKLKISQNQMAEKNQEIEIKIENIKNAENNIQIPFLQMSEKYMAGSYETSDFIKYKGKNVTVEFAGTFENKNGMIKINHLSVYELDAIILPLTMEYEISDGHLIIDTEEVSCDIKVKENKDKEGRIIYTMK